MSIRRRHGMTTAIAAVTAISLAVPAHGAIVANPYEHTAENPSVSLTPIGAYDSGVFDASAAEIVDYHAASQRILTVNAESG